VSESRPSTSSMARAALLVLALAALAGLGLLASACGGSSSEGVAEVETTTTTTTDGSTSSSSSADPAAYAACMRSNGVHEFPDPDSSGRFLFNEGPVDPESDRFRAAREACRELEPPESAPSPAEQAAERERMVAFAACMRENGLPTFPDPEPDGSLMINRDSDLEPDSPQFKAAEQACEEFTPGRNPGDGANGSGETP
jgi:hypothetical protein